MVQSSIPDITFSLYISSPVYANTLKNFDKIELVGKTRNKQSTKNIAITDNINALLVQNPFLNGYDTLNAQQVNKY